MLKGKKIIVTGGSRGIGAEIVRSLSESGAHVAFTYSSNKESAETLFKTTTREGHLTLSMDVSSEESIIKALDGLLKQWPDIDGLVNNAGITKDGLLMRMKSEDFDAVLNTNLKGTFLLTKAITRLMMKARKGSVVNITSVIGQTGNAGQANYAASKAGVVGFSKSVALELGSRGGSSELRGAWIYRDRYDPLLTRRSKTKILEKVPLQRLGNTKDIAEAVKFLLSDQSSYITGHTFKR